MDYLMRRMPHIMRKIQEDKRTVVEKMFIARIGEGIDVDEEIACQVDDIDDFDDIDLLCDIIYFEVEI